MTKIELRPEMLERCTDPRCPCNLPEVLAAGEIVVYPRTWRATVAGHEMRLKPLEFALLTHLVANHDIVCTRAHLIERLWDADCRTDWRTVDVHIRRIRRTLGAHGCAIETVWGVGYRLRAPQLSLTRREDAA